MALNTELQAIKEAIIEDKTLIANAINDKTSGSLTSGDTFEDYASAIGGISGGSGSTPTEFDYSGIFIGEITDAKLQNIANNNILSKSVNPKIFYNGPTSNILHLSDLTLNLDEAITLDGLFVCVNGQEINNTGYYFGLNLTINAPKLEYISDCIITRTSPRKYMDINILINSSNSLKSLEKAFFNNGGLRSISITTTSNVTNMSNMFSGCIGLTTLELSNFNTSAVTTMDRIFENCTQLTNLQLNDLGHNTNCKSLLLRNSSNLTRESCLFLFEHAFDRATAGYPTFTITLHADAKARLSEEDIAIATAKGFTVA